MTSTLNEFNNANEQIIKKKLMHCNASAKWIEIMYQALPFQSVEDMIEMNEAIAEQLSNSDWLEAFLGHPRIGEKKITDDNKKIHQNWSSEEQKDVHSAQASTVDQLALLNEEYYQKFGFIFIICATGKSADTMLHELEKRIVNTLDQEIKNAAKEQIQITNLRLKKLINEKSNNNTYS